ncbi:MAG: hypothetical protein ACOX50_02050 [Patescibacteria group bacterium]|jgi:hypothetical protein
MRHLLQIIKIAVLSIIVALCFSGSVLAAPPSAKSSTTTTTTSTCAGGSCITPALVNPVLPAKLQTLGGAFIQKAISVFISLALFIGFVVFFFFLVIGAIRWITAGGDKGSIESAQKTITNALIGIAILLSIFAIIHLIGFIFDVEILNIKIPTLLTSERG